MFDSLADRLQNIIQNTARQKELTQDNMKDALREIRRALLEADVNLRVVKAFISNIKDKAEGEDIIKGVNPSQQLVKIVNDELVNILGQNEAPLNLENKPTTIMMLGLQGSGKTTSSAKLAVKLKNEGKNPLLVACDVYRPAAINQLKTLAGQIDTECFTIDGSTDVTQIVRSAKEYAKENNYNVRILDTAGRLQIDTDMMAELMLSDRMFQP
jgi:signal recognition particle subunit SRP54